MLVYYYLSTHTLQATLTDSSGNAVSGATVTAVILKDDGVTQLFPATGSISMSDQGGGVYGAANNLPSTLNVKPGQRLRAAITSIAASIKRYAEAEIIVEVDRT